MIHKIFTLAGGLALLTPLALNSKEKPNIIFFLVDDYGWADSQVGYDGQIYPRNEMFHTPNMRRLADMGVRFSHCYASPVSTPTRTSLMTGMNASHSRITNWTSLYKDQVSDVIGGAGASATYEDLRDQTPFERPDWNWNGICPERFLADSAAIGHVQFATPMVQLLRDAGYYTIHVGKAHWAASGTPGASPLNMGFVVNVSGTCAGMPRSYLPEDNYGNTKEKWDYTAVQNMDQYYGTEDFLTEALTKEALKTLDYPVSHKQPFYLYFAHYAVHTPITKDKRFYDRYKGMGQDNGQAKYSSMVEGVDKSLGDVLDYLDEHDLTKNTIIIFMSDNGGNANVKSKGGELHTHNRPLREGKGSCYDGGIRVPMSIYWPGKTEAGRIEDSPVMPEDLFPTILEMAGVRKYSTYQPIDGHSIVPEIIGKESETDREVVFHFPHQWKPQYKPEIDFMSCITKGDWKLVYVMYSRKLELYHVSEDIGETKDVAAEHPEIVKELAKALSDKLRGWNASMPTDKVTGKPLPFADELL